MLLFIITASTSETGYSLQNAFTHSLLCHFTPTGQINGRGSQRPNILVLSLDQVVYSKRRKIRAGGQNGLGNGHVVFALLNEHPGKLERGKLASSFLEPVKARVFVSTPALSV